MDARLFRDPLKQFRPAPFWSWNDDLQPEELRRQVRDMKEKGFGGYFMHSRQGLITEYLSERWMECIAATLDEGKKQDMESWLYDEDRWPSGFAGGIVPARSPEYAIQALCCERAGGAAADGVFVETAAVFELDLDGEGRIRAMRRLARGEPAAATGAGQVCAFNVRRMAPHPRYNNQAYVDLLNPEVTDAFIESTYEAYAARFGREYGEFMPGIFTDEPNYSRGRGVPWTGGLPEYFRRLNGYDVVENLPLLFFPGDGSEKVRYDFWRTCTRRFVEAFTQRLYEHCERKGLALTGHFLAEDTMIAQTRVIGAAMPHYEYMQVPGIDHLRRWIGYPLARKQVSSAAQQFGRNRILCEIFGTSGHSMSFEDQKWIADAHFAMGVTFMDQHLTLYSMPGERKRDYPPTFSEPQPYWPYYRLMNDYLSRCAYAMTRGRRVCDLLVLHPIASVWAVHEPSPGAAPNRDGTEARFYDDQLAALVDNLHAIQRDFDLGDEMILERHGRVEGGAFVVGAMRYRVVIVPPSLNWSSRTVDLVKQFLAAGGRVLVIGRAPRLIDGKPADYARVAGGHHVDVAENTPEALRSALDGLVPRDVSVVGEHGEATPEVLYNHRLDGGEHIYFFTNTSRRKEYRATLSLRAVGSVTEWDTADGSVRPHAAAVRGGRLVLETVLPPVGSRLFVVREGESPESGRPSRPRIVRTIPLHNDWQCRRTHPSSLTLDYATYSVDGEAPSARLPVWKVRHALKARFGLDKYAACQPWVLVEEGIQVAGEHRLVLHLDFFVKEVPPSLHLVIEQPRRWTLKVNGRPVSTETDEWHWDRQFGKISILAAVDEGHNRIEMSTVYRADTEIEDGYLVGDFGVYAEEDGTFHIAGEPEHLDDGDWGPQGYPFYAGNLVYAKDVEVRPEEGRRYVLRLIEPKGTLFRVSVNGGPAVPLCWQPWEADLTDRLVAGKNRVEIEVCGSLRNTMGPLHHKEGDALLWTGPSQFTDEATWTDEYKFTVTGLIGGAEIVVNEA